MQMFSHVGKTEKLIHKQKNGRYYYDKINLFKDIFNRIKKNLFSISGIPSDF